MRIRHDPAGNALQLRLRRGLAIGMPRPARAAIDVGANGRLLGLELNADATLAAPYAHPDGDDPLAPEFDPDAGTLYVPLGPETDDPLARTALAEVTLAVDRAGALLAIDVPRRGHGYEISYPSGNR